MGRSQPGAGRSRSHGADSAIGAVRCPAGRRTRDVDVLIADTAGRPHNKDNLREELKKVVRVMMKLGPERPTEVMLVLDAGTGQNALAQADQFRQWVGANRHHSHQTRWHGQGRGHLRHCKNSACPFGLSAWARAVEDLRPFEAEKRLSTHCSPGTIPLE